MSGKGVHVQPLQLTIGLQAIREIADAMRDLTGNLPPLQGISRLFCSHHRHRKRRRTQTLALKGRNSDPGITNVRNVTSPRWGRWLSVQNRCLACSQASLKTKLLPVGSRPPVWFALDASRSLAFFAGIWTRWTSVRKARRARQQMICSYF